MLKLDSNNTKPKRPPHLVIMDGFYTFIIEQFYIPLYFVVWLVAVIRYRSYFDTPLKYFPIYLMYTFLTELLGYFIKYHDQFQFFSEEEYSWHNVIIYNIYSVVTALFLYYIYWRVLTIEKHKNWIKYVTATSLLGYMVSLFFQDPFHMNLYYADLLASLLLLFVITIYFREQRLAQAAYPRRYNLMFWISFGLAGFHAVFPFLFLIAYEAPHIWAEFQLRNVLKVFIVFMYGSFFVGFLLSKRKAFN